MIKYKACLKNGIEEYRIKPFITPMSTFRSVCTKFVNDMVSLIIQFFFCLLPMRKENYISNWYLWNRWPCHSFGWQQHRWNRRYFGSYNSRTCHCLVDSPVWDFQTWGSCVLHRLLRWDDWYQTDRIHLCYHAKDAK